MDAQMKPKGPGVLPDDLTVEKAIALWKAARRPLPSGESLFAPGEFHGVMPQGRPRRAGGTPSHRPTRKEDE